MITKTYKFVAPRLVEEFYETVQDGEVTVSVSLAAICKADIRYYTGSREQRILDLKYPINPLHEAVGIIRRDKTNVYQPGDKVVLIPNYHNDTECNNCPNTRCKLFHLGSNYCSHSFFASSNCPGFLREYVNLDSSRVVKYEDIEDEHAVFSELMSITFSMTRRVKILKTDVIGIWGDGLLGYLLYINLISTHKNKLIVVGTNPEKLLLFKKAQTFIAGSSELPNCQISLAYEAVGGDKSMNAINEIIDSCIIGSSIILGGVSEEKIPLNTRKILEKGLSIFGVTRSIRLDFESALKIIKKQHNLISKLVLSINEIKDINTIYEIFDKESSNRVLGKNLLRIGNGK